MKKVMIKLIKLYQKTPLNSHGHCKYIPSCSEYSLESYERFGFIKGSILTIKRILRCNPFSKGGLDPVPERKKNEKNI